MEIDMKVKFEIISFMGKVHSIQKIMIIKVIGKMVKLVAKVPHIIAMVVFKLAYITVALNATD
jgi:hypothetical protein